MSNAHPTDIGFVQCVYSTAAIKHHSFGDVNGTNPCFGLNLGLKSGKLKQICSELIYWAIFHVRRATPGPEYAPNGNGRRLKSKPKFCFDMIAELVLPLTFFKLQHK